MVARRLFVWLLLALAFVSRPTAHVSAQTPGISQDVPGYSHSIRATRLTDNAKPHHDNHPNTLQHTDEALFAEAFTRGHRLGTALIPRYGELISDLDYWTGFAPASPTASQFRYFAVRSCRYRNGTPATPPRAPPFCIDPLL